MIDAFTKSPSFCHCELGEAIFLCGIIRNNPNVAKVEDAAAARRQGVGCSRLRRILDNAADAVSSAFPKGKQNGKMS